MRLVFVAVHESVVGTKRTCRTPGPMSAPGDKQKSAEPAATSVFDPTETSSLIGPDAGWVLIVSR